MLLKLCSWVLLRTRAAASGNAGCQLTATLVSPLPPPVQVPQQPKGEAAPADAAKDAAANGSDAAAEDQAAAAGEEGEGKEAAEEEAPAS